MSLKAGAGRAAVNRDESEHEARKRAAKKSNQRRRLKNAMLFERSAP
jgi:hypothetical protein